MGKFPTETVHLCSIRNQPGKQDWDRGPASKIALSHWPLMQTPLEWIKRWWFTYKIEYYSAIKRNEFESIALRGGKLHLL